jgi:diguanylate cyclase (GGDEF)-like protein
MARLSTRGRIVLLVALAGLPALALTAYSTWDEHSRLELQAQDTLRRLATQVAQRQQQVIENAKQTLVAVSLHPASTLTDQKSCNRFLEKLLEKSSGIYHSMGIYRADAVLVCNAVPWKGTVFSPDRLYFRLALSSGQFTVGTYQVGRVTKQKGINFGYPVIDAAGIVTSVAFVAVNLGNMNEMAAAVPYPAQTIVTVIDRDGVVLVQHPPSGDVVGEKLHNTQVRSRMLSGRNGIFRMPANDAVDRLWAYETVTNNPDGVIPMRVLVSIPMNVIYAEANRAFRRYLIGITLATSLLLICAWYGTEIYLVRKVRTLLNAASRVHSGDLQVRTGMPHNGDELSQIGAAFDTMTEELQDRDAKLQTLLLQLKEQVITDPLTGLNNRRYLIDFLQRELERARRSNTPVAAIMLDIDYFKRINDAFGHAAGDLALKAVARLLNEHIRGSDMACRYGGEEFLLILPGATLEGARQRAENLRALVKTLDLKFNGQSLGMITASLGVALFPDHAATGDALIESSDEALYEAKGAGRDRVCVSTTKASTSAIAEKT